MKNSTRAILWMVVSFLFALFSAFLALVDYVNGNWWLSAFMLAALALNVYNLHTWAYLYREYLSDEQQDHPF